MTQTTQTPTLAQQISARYHDDGQRWTDAQAVNLGDALVAAGAARDWRDGRGTDTCRYTLPDGSVITTAGGAWDLGYADCYCWQGAGHDGECVARGGELGAADAAWLSDARDSESGETVEQQIERLYNTPEGSAVIDPDTRAVHNGQKWLSAREVADMCARLDAGI